MTITETRNLAIEFERRIQQIYPNFNLKEKLTSDMIYSILNEYQNTYFKSLILADDQDKSGTRQQRLVDDSISNFVTYQQITPTEDTDMSGDDKYHTMFNIPTNYYAYIRSSSIVSSSYKQKDAYDESEYPSIPNIQVKQGEIPTVLDTVYNHKGILKNPFLIQYNGKFSVIHDGYTNIEKLCLYYYRKPNKFDVSQTPCELPSRCFDDIVQGAVEMYIADYKFKLAGVGQSKRQPKQQEQKEDNE